LLQFEAALGRPKSHKQGVPAKPSRTSSTLDEEGRRDLRRRLAHGVFVSELSRLRPCDYLPELQRERLANSPHVELLGSLLTLRSPRVLELRPRLGAIGASLQRLYGADVRCMPLFQTQQWLIEQAYGIPCDHRLDYDQFTIPYDGCFDLIVANHVLTHAVHPQEVLKTLRHRLTPDGHIYLYSESDETDVFKTGKFLFNTMNAFHFQVFSSESLSRALKSAGFVVDFLCHYAGRLTLLASAGRREMEAMGRSERKKRLAAYERARDLAILRLPRHLQPRFAEQWDRVVERAVVAGLADYDDRGRLHIVKRIRKRPRHANG
jgi:hypothetical protein